MEHLALIQIAGVLAVGIVCQWIAWRMTMPAILPLLAAGFLLGPVLGLLQPQQSLGHLFFPIVSLSVAIILFEGSLTLTWRELRVIASTVRNLLTIGALITWIGGTFAARLIVGLPMDLSLLFGALIIVTGPTVIAPLLRNVRPTAKIASILRWEGIIIDPLGATAAVLVYGLIVAGAEADLGHAALELLRIVLVGSAFGLAGGALTYVVLHRYLLPDYLRDAATLTLVLVVFALSNTIASESGLLAVTVMGVMLANTNLRKLREVLYFKEKLSVLLISTLFILLAANVSMSDLALLNWRSLAVLAVAIFVLRPLGVLASTLGSNLSRNEIVFLSWMAPRGIVAAAVSSLFAFELVERGVEEARILGPLVFLIIVGTVLLQGSTAKWFASLLGVREVDPQGFLIMGANRLAQEIGLALQKEGFTVRLIDSNPRNVRQARLLGLEAMQGNVLSDFVETTMDLSGIGRLLALTNNDEANALACKHFEDEFGSSEVYQLPPHLNSRQSANEVQLGRLLFDRDATYTRLTVLLEQGAVIKRTSLTRQFTLEDFRAQYADSTVIPLMMCRGKRMVVSTVVHPIQPQPGWMLISLVLDRPLAEEQIEQIEASAAEAESDIQPDTEAPLLPA